MAGRIPQSFIDELLSRVDIVEVIDRYVPLKKAGANHKACCPFHSEKTPSFSVNQAKQFYHCFGCQESGNAISFLMAFDHMHFVDAVEYLADRVGLEVPRDAVATVTPSQQGLYDALDECNQFYLQTLRNSQAAIEYLKKRGISGQTAQLYQIGFAPDAWHALTENLNTATDPLISSGMVIRNDSGKTHDRFRNRVMFPIKDRRGRTIGFGGRVMDSSEPKYLNSPETPLFQKGRELYGLYELRKAHRTTPERIIVVEGYMDVVALAESEIHCAVATLGTATSSEQVQLLFRETDEIVFCFDGDNAGKKAAWRALQSTLPSLKSGRDARFLFLPEGEDPDSLVRAIGAHEFMDKLNNEAVEASDFMFNHLEAQANKGSGQPGSGQPSAAHRARLAELAKPLIETIPSGVYRTLVEGQLQSKVGVQVFETPPPVAPPAHKPASNSQKQSGFTPIRRALIAILDSPDIVLQIDPEAYEFSLDTPGSGLLLEVITLVEKNPGITTSAILEQYRDTNQYEHLNKLATEGMVKTIESEIGSPVEILSHAIQQLNRESLKQDLKSHTDSTSPLPSEMTDEQKENVRKKLQQLKNKKP